MTSFYTLMSNIEDIYEKQDDRIAELEFDLREAKQRVVELGIQVMGLQEKNRVLQENIDDYSKHAVNASQKQVDEIVKLKKEIHDLKWENGYLRTVSGIGR